MPLEFRRVPLNHYRIDRLITTCEKGDPFYERGAITAAIRTRTKDIGEPASAFDPAYNEGIDRTISAAVRFCLDAIKRGKVPLTPVPPEIFAQTHLAASEGVRLDTMIHRYVAGSAIINEYLLAEATCLDGVPVGLLQRLARDQSAALEALIATVSEEYERAIYNTVRTDKQRTEDLVRRLVKGEPLDPADLEYNMNGWNLAIVSNCDECEEMLNERSTETDRRLLIAERADGQMAAWLGGRREFGREEMDKLVDKARSSELTVSLGEPGQGLQGWRVSHLQARVALPVAIAQGAVRYGDVALLATALGDQLLFSSLLDTYVKPLTDERDGGEAPKRTLRSYFSSGRSITSAAELVGVTRKTVATRLRIVEERLGRTLDTCSAEAEIALELSTFDTA